MCPLSFKCNFYIYILIFKIYFQKPETVEGGAAALGPDGEVSLKRIMSTWRRHH